VRSAQAEGVCTKKEQAIGLLFFCFEVSCCSITAASLIFGYIGDGAHGALFNAVAASNAGVFVFNLNGTARYFKNTIGALINTNAATNAFISINNRMCHENLPLVNLFMHISNCPFGQNHDGAKHTKRQSFCKH
jgi:hypothetical protein